MKTKNDKDKKTPKNRRQLYHKMVLVPKVVGVIKIPLTKNVR